MSPNNCDKCGHDRNMCSCENKPMSVTQVGGDHYLAEYQHWDWVVDIKMPYLAGCATKYVSRWWKKNGLEDLLKARTYVEKMIATYADSFDKDFNPGYKVRVCTERFVAANKLPDREANFCWTLCGKRDMAMLGHSLVILDDIIWRAKQAPPSPAPVAAPLTPPPWPATLAGQRHSPAQGIVGQGAGTNTSTGVMGDASDTPFGPCPCGCNRPRAKNMNFATPECDPQ